MVDPALAATATAPGRRGEWMPSWSPCASHAVRRALAAEPLGHRGKTGASVDVRRACATTAPDRRARSGAGDASAARERACRPRRCAHRPRRAGRPRCRVGCRQRVAVSERHSGRDRHDAGRACVVRSCGHVSEVVRPVRAPRARGLSIVDGGRSASAIASSPAAERALKPDGPARRPAGRARRPTPGVAARVRAPKQRLVFRSDVRDSRAAARASPSTTSQSKSPSCDIRPVAEVDRLPVLEHGAQAPAERCARQLLDRSPVRRVVDVARGGRRRSSAAARSTSRLAVAGGGRSSRVEARRPAAEAP